MASRCDKDHPKAAWSPEAGYMPAVASELRAPSLQAGTVQTLTAPFRESRPVCATPPPRIHYTA